MMDLVLEGWVAFEIERARWAWMLGGGTGWQPGERLKLLFGHRASLELLAEPPGCVTADVLIPINFPAKTP